MPVLSTAGRNSVQKSQFNSISSEQIAVSEGAQLSHTFHFSNDDEYVGQFTIVKDKQKVTMQGKGVYKTSDGHIYEGLWENDCLKEKCKITFPGALVFSGNLEEMVIQGLGKYTFEENVEIEGVFVNNCLIGEVHLNDPNHHTWKGKAQKNSTCVNFYPLHPFWQSVLNLPSKGIQMLCGEAQEENNDIWEGLY